MEGFQKVILKIKKIAEDTTKDQTERNKARERSQRQISSRVDLQKQLDQLKAGEYTRDGEGQSIPLEVFQKKRRKKARKRKTTTTRKTRTRKIINDENTPLSEREKQKKKWQKFLKN